MRAYIAHVILATLLGVSVSEAASPRRRKVVVPPRVTEQVKEIEPPNAPEPEVPNSEDGHGANKSVKPLDGWSPPKYELQLSAIPLLVGPELDLRLEMRDQGKQSILVRWLLGTYRWTDVRWMDGRLRTDELSVTLIGIGVGAKSYIVDRKHVGAYAGLSVVAGVATVDGVDEVVEFGQLHANAVVGAQWRLERRSLSVAAGYQMTRFLNDVVDVVVHGPLVEVVAGFAFGDFHEDVQD
jgi:hypothetical protein